MKKLIIALAIVLSAGVATAQDKAQKVKGDQLKATPEQRAQKMTDRMDKTVTLTSDQKTKVYDLSLSKANKLQAIREKYKGQPEQKETAKGEAKAVRNEYESALKALLTPEQAATLEARKKERQEKTGKHGKMNPEQKAQRSVDKLDETVTLTPDQKTKVYDLALTKAKKSQELREKYKGQPEQKEAVKGEMKAIHKEYKQAVKALLTPEQLAKLEAKRKEHHKEGKGQKTKPSVKETEIKEK